MYLQDISIRCRCGEEFTWTKGEQRFMTTLVENGKIDRLVQPRRCAKCREEKKKYLLEREQQEQA